MGAVLRIEPVRPRDHDRAVSVLLGRAAPPQQAEALLNMLTGPDAQQCLLWWARGLRGPRAAAMSLRSPGRTAAMFNSRPRHGRDVRVLARLLTGLTDATIRAGTVYAQALLPPNQRHAAEAYVQAGYEYLTQLVYLRRPVRTPAGPPCSELRWKTVEQAGDELLKQVIADTYVDSRDCPSLLGLRTMDDVIAGHRASGVYRPEGWLLPHKGQECVGCVLVNDAGGRPEDADVVYLGVRPAWRRRGFGRAMIHRAVGYASARGQVAITLAVDAANAPAVNLYRSEGFAETSRRDVYARCVRQAARSGRE